MSEKNFIDIIERIIKTVDENIDIEKIKEYSNEDEQITAQQIHELLGPAFPNISQDMVENHLQPVSSAHAKITGIKASKKSLEVNTLGYYKRKHKNMAYPICSETVLGRIVKENSSSWRFEPLSFEGKELHIE